MYLLTNIQLNMYDINDSTKRFIDIYIYMYLYYCEIIQSLLQRLNIISKTGGTVFFHIPAAFMSLIRSRAILPV